MRTKVKNVIRFSIFLLLIIWRIHLNNKIWCYEKTRFNSNFTAMSIAGMIGTIASAAIAGGAAIYGNHQRNEAQRRENEKAYLREKEQIAQMNAYNSASAQAARLRAAGLNPNVMYDSGPAAAAGQQTDSAHYQPADITNAVGSVGEEAGSLVNSLIGIREQENKNDLAKSQVELNAAVKELDFSQKSVNETIAQRNLELLGYEKDKLAAEAENQHTSALLNRANETLAKEKVGEVVANRKLLLKKFDVAKAEEKELLERALKLSAETARIVALLPSEQAWMNASAAERMAMVVQASYQNRVLEAEEALKYAQAKGVRADIKVAEQRVSYLKHQTIQGYIQTGADAIYKVAGAVAQFYNPMASMAQTYGTIEQSPVLMGQQHTAPVWNIGPDGVLNRW